jgi:hypothetical protein
VDLLGMNFHLALRYRKTFEQHLALLCATARSKMFAGSGFANISDSVTRANPSIAEPSKPIPSAKAFPNSAGAIATDFRKPNTSVNHKRMKRMLRSSNGSKDELLLLISISLTWPHSLQMQVTAMLTSQSSASNNEEISLIQQGLRAKSLAIER